MLEKGVLFFLNHTAMKTLMNLFLILVLAVSCSSDGGNGEEITKDGPFAISELAGNWEATQAVFSGDNTSVNIIQEGGSASLNVQSNGRFTLTIDPANRTAYSVRGEMFWEKWEGRFYFAIRWDDYPDDWDTYGHTKTATTFALNGGFDSGEYDFDNDGTMESASINFSFLKV